MSSVLNSGVPFKTGPTGYGCVSRRYMQVHHRHVVCMSTVARIHLGRAGITPLESVLASLEQYVLFVQGKSCLSPLTLLCLHFPPPLTGFLNEMLSGTPLNLGTSVLCIQQVTTAFPQLLGQTHFSERFFISTSANTDCIHQLILMA